MNICKQKQEGFPCDECYHGKPHEPNSNCNHPGYCSKDGETQLIQKTKCEEEK